MKNEIVTEFCTWDYFGEENDQLFHSFNPRFWTRLVGTELKDLSFKKDDHFSGYILTLILLVKKNKQQEMIEYPTSASSFFEVRITREWLRRALSTCMFQQHPHIN